VFIPRPAATLVLPQPSFSVILSVLPGTSIIVIMQAKDHQTQAPNRSVKSFITLPKKPARSPSVLLVANPW